jgi:hypothetical protein
MEDAAMRRLLFELVAFALALTGFNYTEAATKAPHTLSIDVVRQWAQDPTVSIQYARIDAYTILFVDGDVLGAGEQNGDIYDTTTFQVPAGIGVSSWNGTGGVYYPARHVTQEIGVQAVGEFTIPGKGHAITAPSIATAESFCHKGCDGKFTTVSTHPYSGADAVVYSDPQCDATLALRTIPGAHYHMYVHLQRGTPRLATSARQVCVAYIWADH